MSEVIQQSRPIKNKGVADIVFCFDCTASMQPCIDKVKDNVHAFVNALKDQPQVVLDWRVRAMGYRDFDVDSEKIINHFPFVKDADSFKEQLDKLEATGGGDSPESTLDALWYAFKKTDWREKCHKVIVLFTDADSKPVHPETVKTLGVTGDLRFLQQELMKSRIKLFLFGLSCDIYDQLGLTPKSEIKLYPNPKKEFATADFEKLLEMIAKTVSSEAVMLPTL